MSPSRARSSLDSPLLHDDVVNRSSIGRRSSVTEAPRGLIQYERENSNLYESGAHWLQTTSALLALQLGWGLWLFPADFARLGWYTSACCLVILSVLTAYSGFLFSRLYTSVPGTVLFGDIGFKAAGSFGRNIVYIIVYSLDATRCVILHLAASQSLRHIFPVESRPPVWQCGAVVMIVASALVQIRSLAELSWVFTAGTGSQLIAIAIVLYELITDPDPNAKHSSQAISLDTLVPSSVAVMNMIFAFGGQFAFTEIMSSMRKPKEFPKAVTSCTVIMATLYAAVGIVGYWSRGESITGIVIFSLGDSPRIRFAAGLILIQATSQYLVNLNVWTHNLLTLISRVGEGEGEGEGGEDNVGGKVEGEGEGEPSISKAAIQSSADHSPWRWAGASVFVVAYSYLISTSVPYFGTLVGLVTASTYLICAYALPSWFTLRLMARSLGGPERVLLWSLIPLSFVFSGIGLYGSIMSLIDDIEGGEGGGWNSRHP